MKRRFYLASIAMGVALAVGLGLPRESSPSLAEIKPEITENKSEMIDDQAMFSEFERLKSRAESGTRYQSDVFALKRMAQEYAESSQSVHRQRELLLAGKALVEGQITLTDDERETLQELNQQAERIQKRFLASYHSIKR